jgi:hypothetical protein
VWGSSASRQGSNARVERCYGDGMVENWTRFARDECGELGDVLKACWRAWLTSDKWLANGWWVLGCSESDGKS